MNDQPSLFDTAGPSHHGDPWTSANAARSVNRSPQRLAVLRSLAHARTVGRTDSELGSALGIRETAAGTRRKELERLGFVERTERTRLTAYGNPALVHVITDAGLAALDQIAEMAR